MFTPAKAAQIAAFFAGKNGEPINVMKLVKLMYLSDREALLRYGEPISFDRMVSMDNGPVPSQTLNLINGDVSREAAAIWDSWISDRAEHKVALKGDPRRERLDQLSDADLEVLEFIWLKFGGMNQWQLSDYTHKHCPEWTHPDGTCTPIADADLLMHVGKSREEAETLAQDIQTERRLDRLFSRL